MKSYKINDGTNFDSFDDSGTYFIEQFNINMLFFHEDLLPLTKALIDNMTKREQLDLFYLLQEKITGEHIELPKENVNVK